MRKPDLEKIDKATEAAIKALRPHFAKLVACGAKKDHIWWDLMEAIDFRKARKPRPSWSAQHAASERARHAREGKAKKHGYADRNDHIQMQYERSLEMGEKSAAVRLRLAKLYKLTPRRISMIVRLAER